MGQDETSHEAARFYTAAGIQKNARICEQRVNRDQNHAKIMPKT